MSVKNIEQLISGNNIYQANIERWKFLYNSFIGGQTYRDAAYLTRYQNETADEYKARLNNTPLDNHCASIIQVYNSFLFRSEPERDYGSMTNLPELNDFIKDADFEGRDITAFMKEVSTWSNVFGHSFILVSKPNIGALTRADEIVNQVRPYVSLLTPMTVLDWTWERQVNGRYELVYFKYVEDLNGDTQTVKEWYPELIKTTSVNIIDDMILSEEVEVNQLGQIPVIICYAQRSIIRGIGSSSISDVADTQRFIYNALSEADQSIRLDSHPSLVTTPDANVGTGAGAIITISETSDPGLKPYVLDFAGANIQSIYTVIDKAVASIDKMSNVGGVRSTLTQSMSGVALQTEFQLLNARLSQMASNLSLAEEQLWRLFCLYQNQPYDVSISYPESFEIRDTENEIQQLQTAKSAATDPRILAAIDIKILDWLELDEDEIIAMLHPTVNDMDLLEQEEGYYKPKMLINPQTLETKQVMSYEEEQALALEGWVEKED